MLDVRSAAMVRLLFPDGTSVKGEDAHDVLARLGRLQWTPMDVDTIKARLADRALAWNGALLDPTMSDDDFLDDLSASAMIAVERTARKAAGK